MRKMKILLKNYSEEEWWEWENQYIMTTAYYRSAEIGATLRKPEYNWHL